MPLPETGAVVVLSGVVHASSPGPNTRNVSVPVRTEPPASVAVALTGPPADVAVEALIASAGALSAKLV